MKALTIGGTLLVLGFLALDIGGLIWVWDRLPWWAIILWMLATLRLMTGFTGKPGSRDHD